MSAGLALGILIGIISGIVFLLLLKTADRLTKGDAKAILAFTAELLAIPTFMLGGPWITGSLLQVVPLPDLINPYLNSLVITFPVILIYPAGRWIIRSGQELGRGSG